MKRLKFVILAAAMALPSAAMWAQQAGPREADSKLDLAICYTAAHSSIVAGSGFWAQGGGAELTGTFYHGLGVSADIAGTHADKISPTGVGLTLVTAVFGPTYTWAPPRSGKKWGQWSIFGESLLGVANALDSTSPAAAGAQSSAESLALEIGGGADLNLSRHIALRAFKADWLRTQLPNAAANVQNSLQLGSGIVFRLP